MLTLRQLQTLLDSYGADVGRWPEETRADARALLQSSGDARALQEEACELDDMIAAAGAHEDESRWRTGERDVAMARLRARVSARIATVPVKRPALLQVWMSGVLGPREAGERSAAAYHLRWVGFATTGAFAVIAGLMIGAMYESGQAGQGALAPLLQPSAFTILEN